MTNDELEKLKSTKSENEWNVCCDQIKKAHNGYPDDWYQKVVLSGLMAETQASW